MGSRNKIVRQESWLQNKAAKGKQQIADRRERRREEEKHPELKAERLAKNKPKTLEDKRIYPSSEDYYSRRKRRRVVEEKPADEEAGVAEEIDEGEEEDGDGDKMEVEQEGDKAVGDDEVDSDIASLLASDDEEGGDDNTTGLSKADKKTRRAEAAAAAEAKRKEQDEKEEAEEAAARAAHEDAMAAKYSALLPPETPLADGAKPEQPKILITTSRHATIHRFAQTLSDVFPNSTYIPRSGHRYVSHEYSVREIASYAHNRGYTALLILNEDQKKPSGLDITLLPDGPMLHFSIQTWVDAKRLPNHARSTGHVPETIMNNFDTPLGKLVGGVLGRLFPKDPELIGRTVLTLHNQRDYVFVRRHRYAMREKRATERSVTEKDGKAMTGVEDVRVALQEIGPRMTLKLRRVDKGIQRMSGQAFEWKGRMEKKRTVWQL
ncbi:Ribosome production factor 1 [Sporothrix curviconia]|uniref:Ribosome production factor 1 n=1 Tax=Sporothrix curviconia TaxID=1260050 RepID=A0ABP0BLW9_9PEZI